MSQIQYLNDSFRKSFMGGRLVLTQGIAALNEELQAKVLHAVSAFDQFNQDNDPHGEHDFGTIYLSDLKVFWKIDYYNRTMDGGSENPADPAVTTRVMTIMLAEEY